MDESPLIQALKGKQPKAGNDPQAILDFIMAHFNLVPKETQEADDKPEMVMTQESHTP